MDRLGSRFFALSMCLSLFTIGDHAVAQSAKDLVGTWTPVSVEAFGPNPKGLLMFQDNGRFSLQLMRGPASKVCVKQTQRRNGGGEQRSGRRKYRLLWHILNERN